MEKSPRFPKVLLDRLWHSTSVDRFRGIIKDRAILPDPSEVPNDTRWCTSKGPSHYPFVRKLGGVSLFDFKEFDPIRYNRAYSASWHTFVPDMRGGGNKIWIEIDRELVREALINCSELVAKWEAEKAYRHNFMPMIEAAHIGAIPSSKFVMVISCESGQWEKISI